MASSELWPGTPVRRRYIVLGLGMFVGHALWASWAYLPGRGSPWNGGAPYLGSLFVAGLILGALDPLELWPGPAGLYLGQALAMGAQVFFGLAGKSPEPLPFRFLFLVSLTLSAVLGAALPDCVRIWMAESRRASTSKTIGLVLLLLSVTWTAEAQSLGEVAAREQARREALAALGSGRLSELPGCSDQERVALRAAVFKKAGDNTTPQLLCGPSFSPPSDLGPYLGRAKVCLRLTVSDDGSVAQVETLSSTADASSTQDLLDKLRASRYWPAHAGGAPVRRPLEMCVSVKVAAPRTFAAR